MLVDPPAAVAAREGVVHPDYGGYCFAGVGPTAAALLGADVPADRRLPGDALTGAGDPAPDHVVVVVLDGLGWDRWRALSHGNGFLRRVTAAGRVTPLTSTYPSETAAAITTLHTGRTPVEHGLLGWDQYLREHDVVAQTLPFTTADGTPVPEVAPDVDGRVLFDGDSLYERYGLDAHVFGPRTTVGTAYAAYATAGATEHGYDSFADGVAQLQAHLEASEGGYSLLYAPHVDAAGHARGTESGRYRSTVALLGSALERLVDTLDPGVAERTHLLATADHGQVDTGPAVDQSLANHPVTDHLERRPDGSPVPPLGGPRNVQFHVRDGHLAAARDALGDLDARVLDAAEYRDAGLFGPQEPGERFAARAPDLLAVPARGAAWHEAPALELVGMHGGLHPREMQVPLASVALDAL